MLISIESYFLHRKTLGAFNGFQYGCRLYKILPVFTVMDFSA